MERLKIRGSRTFYSQLLEVDLYHLPRPGFKAGIKFADILLPYSFPREHILRRILSPLWLTLTGGFSYWLCYHFRVCKQVLNNSRVQSSYLLVNTAASWDFSMPVGEELISSPYPTRQVMRWSWPGSCQSGSEGLISIALWSGLILHVADLLFSDSLLRDLHLLMPVFSLQIVHLLTILDLPIALLCFYFSYISRLSLCTLFWFFSQ